MTSDPSSLPSEAAQSLVQQTWWHKLLIWGTFLVLLYVLREFFLIGFLTFLFCFVVRSAVGFLTKPISADGEKNRRIDLILTLSVFLGICLALYGLGRFFVPQLVRQGRSLVTRMQNSSAGRIQNTLLANTVGRWKFENQFGKRDDPRYQKGLIQFQAAGRNGEGLYQEFPKLHSSLEAEFEANYEQARVLHLQSQTPQETSAGGPLQRWFLDVKSDPVLLADLKNQWAHADSIQKWEGFRASPEYQAEFKEFYAKQREQSPSAVPIDYAYYQTLATSYPKGKPAFLAVVRRHDETQKVSETHQQFDFESATKLELGQQWWATSHVADWFRDHAANDGPKWLEAMVKRVDEGLGSLVKIPIQVITALVLAVFILIEWHGMKTSVADLRNTRLRPIFDEIAPGAVALGKLIGKAFEGQVIIAIAIVHLTESMILSPRIIGKIGHLHPVLVIAILLVAEHFFGMWGLVLGVPVAIYIIRVVILRSPIPGIYQPPGQESAALAEQ